MAAVSVLPTFKKESEMTSVVQSWLERQKLLVKPEFCLPWGVCDLVGVRFRLLAVRKRLSLGQTRPIGATSSLRILSSVPDASSGCSVSLQDLQDQLEHLYSRSFVADEVSRLERNRFVASSTPGHYQKLNGWAPLHSCLTAVELKLNRVNDAIDQATANQAFAEKSYIALPLEKAKRWLNCENNGRLEEKGLGLLAVSPRSCRELVKPSISLKYHDQILQLHCVERFWRTRDSSTSTV